MDRGEQGEPADDIGTVLRALAPQVLGALVRHYGRFDACEDAVQEALLDAAVTWARRGIPQRPRGWLITVASRRFTDQLRSDTARRRREAGTLAREPDLVAPAADVGDEAGTDDTVTLLLLCCHPALSPPSQVALTLRAVGGLSTVQIARAFLVPEATMAQRISRAKQQVTAAGARFALPDRDLEDRLGAVLHVLYLIFNEGYTASSGTELVRGDLSGEAIRLARQVRRMWPENGEVGGLLALMLLTDARRPARTRRDGALVPLAEQARDTWDRDLIAEGTALISATLTAAPLGPFQLQAAIAAVHDEATHATDTDWPQILALYDLLARSSTNPVVALNRAVAVAMVHGPQAGLDLIADLARDRRLTAGHRIYAVRAHLHERAGDLTAASAGYRDAARRATSIPEQRYLCAQADRLAARAGNPGGTT